MEYKPLSIKNVILGKLGNLMSYFIKKKTLNMNIEGYTFLQDITPSYTSRKNRVGIYTTKQNKKVVIKRVGYSMENLDSIYLRNEAYILERLSQVNNGKRVFPNFIDFRESRNEAMLITEFFEGKNLDKVKKKIRIDSIISSYEYIKDLSSRLNANNFNGLPIRKPFYYLLSFPLNVFKIILKKPSSLPFCLRYSVLFYINYVRVAFGDYSLGISHRDLYPDNILRSNSSEDVKIIDWESAAVTDSLYDLSQISMIYTKEMGVYEMIAFLRSELNDNSSMKRFYGLSVFNSMQILSNNNPESIVYKDTAKYLVVLREKIIKEIFYEKSLFQLINGFTMKCINFFYAITRLSKYSTNKKIIICYHSVGNNNWNFSTYPKDLEKHISFLKKNYKILDLRNILVTNSSGVHICFDDGYENVLQNAVPIVENAGIRPTMFVLGDYKKANRKELNNTLPIINFEQIKKLHKSGWEIGYHTETHANLGELNKNELNSEVILGKKEFEKNVGFSVKYFAYPKGIYTNEIIEIVKKAGFEAAFTTDGGSVDTKNKFKISRICLEGSVRVDQFGAMISPIGLFVSGLFIKLLIFKAKYITRF